MITRGLHDRYAKKFTEAVPSASQSLGEHMDVATHVTSLSDSDSSAFMSNLPLGDNTSTVNHQIAASIFLSHDIQGTTSSGSSSNPLNFQNLVVSGNISALQVRVSDIKSKLETLCLKEQELFSTSVEAAVYLELLELKLKTIRLEISYLKDNLISTNEMPISGQNNASVQPKLLAIRSGFVDRQTMAKDHTAIVASDFSVFEIKPTFVLSLGGSGGIQSGDDKSSDTLIRRFERFYKNNQDIITKFDLASETNVIQRNEFLLHLCQNNNESLTECLDRFRLHVVAVNANTEDNLFLSYHFILSSFAKEFGDIVDKTLMEHYLRTKAYSNPNSAMGENNFARKAYIHYALKSFSALGEILIANIISLEQALGKIQHSIRQKKAKTDQPDDNLKKKENESQFL
ncbi:hypothetical protein G6F70_003296 [Rhizopus microsporus]|uniref:Uncharacterized protein n=1 Tax=Rhizopus azygosporus TaxID=86630 RepID=A0A367JUW4_RHIAZ|nr:hypothetical protein G6F71_003102 [Rhizopus microsporus]RCH93697.1 hypothetical protein CU097_002467 [Rhizopus azygosporus]KAG1201270.1 hypothetical protein G6F70_003296 [Rhizopus microsporus]KAG1214489.1 hypothetical protein G6F69_001851 [Rhizopus microsporus]KAG1227424.1 hypothetical protein G6F67_008461 [Rhizopus microsporus]